jgi:hypothetical protein
MGNQQLLLIILGVIVVGVAIGVGMELFTGTSVGTNRDAIINDLLNLGQYAYRYKLTPVPYGGGGRTFTGFSIPAKLDNNPNAMYTSVSTAQTVTFTATSNFGYGTISAVLDSTGTLANFSYVGVW